MYTSDTSYWDKFDILTGSAFIGTKTLELRLRDNIKWQVL